jgi:hypothetical protein
MLSSPAVPVRLSFEDVPVNTANVFFLMSVNRRGRFLHQHQALINYQVLFPKIMQIFQKSFLGKFCFIGNQKCYDYHLKTSGI